MRLMSVLLLLLACFPDPEPSAGDACTECHGSPETGPAPPVALGGFTSEDNFGVGAHQAHVLGTRLGSPVACSECHLWPDTVDAEGHTDTPWPAEVIWGDVAKADEGAGPWDREDATCTVYCHGSTLEGGFAAAPGWMDKDGEAAQCGACHGNPPPPPHAQSAVCADCHGQLRPDTHINGRVECWNDAFEGAETDGTSGATSTGGGTGTVDEGSCDLLPCSLCHGTDQSAAPPPDTLGNTLPSARGVGAHDTHLGGTATAAAVPCWTCHTEVHGATEPGHIDAGPAEVVMSGIAASHGVTPDYDPAGLTCITGCHGIERWDGAVAAPVWNVTDGTQSFCGSCHAMPPPAPHPPSAACASCHPDPVLSPDTHVNGTLDF